MPAAPLFATSRAPGLGSWADRVMALAEALGEPLFPWQGDVLDQWLEHDDAGRLTRLSAGLVVPRRNGKSHLIAYRILAGLLLLGERRVLYTAHSGQLAQEMYRQVIGLLEHDLIKPHLPGRPYMSEGRERIEFENGSRFWVRSRRHGDTVRGLEADLLIIDEALFLTNDQLSALTPLLAKGIAQGRGQMILTSSAGDQAAATLARFAATGRQAAGRSDQPLAWHEWAAPEGSDITSPETWALANPSLGDIVPEQYLAGQLEYLSPEAFAREHLGVWGSTRRLPAIEPAAWNALAAEERPDGVGGAWLSFDVSVDLKAARVLLFRPTPLGRLAVSCEASWDGDKEIQLESFAEELLGLCRKHDPETVGYSRRTGEFVARKLEADGYQTKALPPGIYANACMALESAVASKQIIHDGHPSVAEDLGRAVRKPFSDGTGWTFVRDSTAGGPIPAAVALAVGYWIASDALGQDADIRV